MTRATVLVATFGIVAIACGGKIETTPTPSPDPVTPVFDPPTADPEPTPGRPPKASPSPQDPASPSDPGSPGQDPSSSDAPSAYPRNVQTACGAPVIDVLDCDTAAGYEVYTYRPKLVGDTEVNVVGVYETSHNREFRVHPLGEATVKVTRHAKQILVLSSYEPTHWTVTLDAGVTVEKVITFGYYDQPVTFVSGSAPVDHRGFACGYSWPYNGEGCDTDSLFTKSESGAKAPIAAFAGCYAANTFVVRDDSEICK